MELTQQLCDAFHQFLMLKGVTSKCSICAELAVGCMPSIAFIEDASRRDIGIRLIATRCGNCGAMQFFDPRAAGISL
jgi:hypothetical protein